MTEESMTNAIEMIADKLGVACDQVMETLLLQARITMAKSGFWLVFCVFVIVFTVVTFRKLAKDLDDPDTDDIFDLDDGELLGLGLAAVVLIAASIAAACSIRDSLNTIIDCALNPLGWAISKILGVKL